MADDNSIKYLCLGFGLGITAGILWAPKSGNETRTYLRKRAAEGTDYVSEQAKAAADSAASAINRGTEAVRNQKENVMAAMEAARDAYRDSVTSVRTGDLNS